MKIHMLSQCSVRSLVLITGFGLLAGCASPPKLATVSSVSDDSAAYLVFGALGNTARQREVAARMAEKSYREIKTLRPDAGERFLHVWQDYLVTLQKPIPIDTQSYQNAPELKPVSDLKLVASYISANPAAMNLEGATLSADWEKDVADTRRLIEELQATVSAATQEAKTLAGEKSWTEAYAAISKAVLIAPRDKNIMSLARQIQDEVAGLAMANLQETIRQFNAVRENFGDRQSSLEKVMEVEALLFPAIQQALTIEDMMTRVSIPFSDKEAKAKLSDLRASAVEASGPLLGEIIRLHAAKKDFWRAYELTIQSLATLDSVPVLRASGASNVVIKAYGDQLGDSIRFFLEKSNEGYYNDRFGVAFLVSRMCREIFDYAVVLGIQEPGTVMPEIAQADQTAEDATSRIGAQFARRLLVTDFVPAVTEDYENIGFQIRTRCRYLTLPDNGLAWAMEVPAPLSLVLENVSNITPLDLALSGVMDKKIQVDVLPPVELERGFTEVGTSLIREVPNPMYDLRDKEPRLSYSQEVHLYPWIKSLHRKQARIAFRVVREMLNGPAITIYKVDETFPNGDMTFKGLSIEAENLAYHPMIIGTPRIQGNSSGFNVDKPPVGSAPALAPNDEIASAVINHVINGVMSAIEQEVVQFPIENIAAKAVEQQGSGQLDLASDSWGHFLVYIDKLAPGIDKAGYSWIMRRDALSSFIQEWSSTRWSKQPPEVMVSVNDAWNKALAAYLNAK